MAIFARVMRSLLEVSTQATRAPDQACMLSADPASDRFAAADGKSLRGDACQLAAR